MSWRSTLRWQQQKESLACRTKGKRGKHDRTLLAADRGYGAPQPRAARGGAAAAGGVPARSTGAAAPPPGIDGAAAGAVSARMTQHEPCCVVESETGWCCSAGAGRVLQVRTVSLDHSRTESQAKSLTWKFLGRRMQPRCRDVQSAAGFSARISQVSRVPNDGRYTDRTETVVCSSGRSGGAELQSAAPAMGMRSLTAADTQTEPFLSYVLQDAAAGAELQSAAGASEDALGRNQLVAVMGGLHGCLRDEQTSLMKVGFHQHRVCQP